MAKVLQFVKDYLSQRKEKMDVISYLEEQLELKDLQKMTKIELDENVFLLFSNLITMVLTFYFAKKDDKGE